MLGKAAAVMLRPTPPPPLCSNQSFLLPQPAGRPIGTIDSANERLLLIPTQLPLGVQVASVPAGLTTRQGSENRISVIVMPTGHLMLADVMALPAVLADAAAAAAAAAAASTAVAACVGGGAVTVAPPAFLPESSSFMKMETADEIVDMKADDDELSVSASDDLNKIHNHLEQEQHQSVVDGVDLNEIGQFAREFKLRRLRLGLTQTQIGAALSAARGPAYSQSAISRFEKLDVTPRSAARIKQALQTWLTEAEESAVAAEEAAEAAAAAAAAAVLAAVADKESAPESAVTPTTLVPALVVSTGADVGGGGSGSSGSGGVGKRPRKRRTSFTPEALEALNGYFELNQHPSGAEVTQLARALRYSREVIRVWFCNRRQALRANTVKRLRPPPSADVAANRSSAAGAAVVAAVAVAPASSPSPSDSPVNLSQQSTCTHQVARAAVCVPLCASPRSESSAPTPT